MIEHVTNENDFEDPIYIEVRTLGNPAADLEPLSADMMEVNAKWLSFESGDGGSVTGSATWLVMERDAAFFFTIKYSPYIIATISDEEMNLLVPRIRQETSLILLTLWKIAIAIELGYIPDIKHFLYITETMNLVRIVTDHVNTAYFV